MKIIDKFKQKKPVISFEIFPPKKNLGIETLYESISEFKDLNPDFISVTYSAGGSGNTNETLKIASDIKNKYNIEALIHLTCINSGKSTIDGLLAQFKENNIENILALRGDIPENAAFLPNEYKYAKDLISHIKSISPGFCISAAAYPEGHVDCDDYDQSLVHLKQKQDLGAEFLITQLFFDNDIFYRFYEKSQRAGITVPITAGIMPVLNKNQVERMIYMCGASLPSRVVRILNRYQDSESLRKAGIEYSCQQAYDLQTHGVDGIHIYTMNKPDIARENMKILRYAY